MKKNLLIIVGIVLCLSIDAEAAISREFSINDSILTKSKCWEVTKKWVATALDSYGAYVAYENEDKGEMIIKGRYKDSNNRLWAVQESFIIPYISFEIEINMRDGLYFAKYSKVSYVFKNGYGGRVSGYSKIFLLRMKNELEEIQDLMISKGEDWVIDESFEINGEEWSRKIKEAEERQNDKSISKKERKKYNQFYEENVGRDAVYHNVNYGVHRLVYDTFYEEPMGLEYLIKNLK